jgi:hypothetical protein
VPKDPVGAPSLSQSPENGRTEAPPRPGRERGEPAGRRGSGWPLSQACQPGGRASGSADHWVCLPLEQRAGERRASEFTGAGHLRYPGAVTVAHVASCPQSSPLAPHRNPRTQPWSATLVGNPGPQRWPAALACGPAALAQSDSLTASPRRWPKTLAEDAGRRRWPKTLAEDAGRRRWPKTLAEDAGPRRWPKTLAQDAGRRSDPAVA